MATGIMSARPQIFHCWLSVTFNYPEIETALDARNRMDNPTMCSVLYLNSVPRLNYVKIRERLDINLTVKFKGRKTQI